MEILGIGAPELVFVIIIALIILGPKDMQKAGRTIGRWLNQLVQSDGWKAFQQTSREIRNLPNNLMRQANMELAETEKELRKATDIRVPPTAGPSRVPPSPQATENSIRPPSADPAPAQADAKPDAEDSTGNSGADNSTQGKPPPANPSKTQPEIEPKTATGVESIAVNNSTHSEPASAQPPEAQGDMGSIARDSTGSGTVEEAAQSEPPAANLPATQSIGGPDAENVPDVNTTDQNA